MSKQAEEEAIVRCQSFIRYYISKKQYIRLQKRNAHRDAVVREIFSTEQIYVKNLQVIIGIFLNPLRSSLLGDCLCSNDNLKIIFSNIEGIFALNSSLLSSLSQRIQNWTNVSCIGDVFLQLTPYLKMYTQYCNNYQDALSAIQQCNQDPRFTQFIEDLFKHTAKEHKDYALLESALKETKEVANYLNHQMKVNNSMKEIYRIIEEIGAEWDLFRNDRFLVKEGRFKQYTTKTTSRRVKYYLFTDLIVLALKNHDWIYSKRKFEYWCKIELPGCWISPRPDSSDLKNCTTFVGPEESLIFSFDTPNDRDDWASFVSDTIDQLYQKNPNLKKENFPLVTEKEKEKEKEERTISSSEAAENYKSKTKSWMIKTNYILSGSKDSNPKTTKKQSLFTVRTPKQSSNSPTSSPDLSIDNNNNNNINNNNNDQNNFNNDSNESIGGSVGEGIAKRERKGTLSMSSVTTPSIVKEIDQSRVKSEFNYNIKNMIGNWESRASTTLSPNPFDTPPPNSTPLPPQNSSPNVTPTPTSPSREGSFSPANPRMGDRKKYLSRIRNGMSVFNGVPPSKSDEYKTDIPIHEGYLKKKGEINPAWKKRYFKVINKHLWYFKSPNDSSPIGVIDLAKSVLGVPEEKEKEKEKEKDCIFTVQFGDRVYYLCAESKRDLAQWLTVLRNCS